MKSPKVFVLALAVLGVLSTAGGSLPVQVDDIGVVGPEYFQRRGGYVSLTESIAASGRSLLTQPRANGEIHDSWVYTPDHGSVLVGATPAGRQVTVTTTSVVLGLTSQGLAYGYAGEQPNAAFTSGGVPITTIYRIFFYEPGKGETDVGLVDPSLPLERHSTFANDMSTTGYTTGTTTFYFGTQAITKSWLRSPTGQYFSDLDPDPQVESHPFWAAPDGRVMGNNRAPAGNRTGWVYTPGAGSRLLPTTTDGRSLVEPLPYKQYYSARTERSFGDYDGVYITDGLSSSVRIDNTETLTAWPGKPRYAVALTEDHPRFVAGFSSVLMGGFPSEDPTTVFAYTPENGTATLGIYDQHHQSNGFYHHNIAKIGDNAVTGYSYNFSRDFLGSTPWTPWYWTPERGMQELHVVDPTSLGAGTHYTSTPRDVNARNQIVGYTTFGDPTDDEWFTRRQEGWFYDLATDAVTTLAFPGSSHTFASDISDFGIVAGFYYLENPLETGSERRFFVWSEATGYIDFRDLHPALADLDENYAYALGEDLPVLYLGSGGQGVIDRGVFVVTFIPEPTLAAALFAPALLLRRPSASRRL